jgi:hypothetical protein
LALWSAIQSEFKIEDAGGMELLAQACAAAAAEGTMSQRVRKLPRTAFKLGCAPGPGWPKGSRTKLQELALAMLAADFAEHGEAVIRKVRERKPETYLVGVLNLLPREKIETHSAFSELTDEELLQLEGYLAGMRARTVSQIELHAANDTTASRQPVKAVAVEKRSLFDRVQLVDDSAEPSD